MEQKPSDERLLELEMKWLSGIITDAEKKEYAYWYNSFNDGAILELPEKFASDREEHRLRILRGIDQNLEVLTEFPPVHRVHFLKTTWFRYAAILLLIAGTATFLYLEKQESSRPTARIIPIEKQDILPGGNHAVLTLADGSAIILDSAAIGSLAVQGGTKVLKLDAGSLAYNAGAAAEGEAMYNTISTPKGGYYQIVLPDDTRVWLNAASSLRFPTSFTGQKRTVTLTGEGYFEVTANTAQPFIVHTYKDEINVLGTSFNVCSYLDEPGIKTSLIIGKVQINQQILRPGEAYRDGKISKTDIEQDLAWKNGTFNFNRVTLKDAMRQLARWYDVAVDYPESLADKQFGGEMGRDLTLSEVLELLNGTDMHFSLQGRTITVTR